MTREDGRGGPRGFLRDAAADDPALDAELDFELWRAGDRDRPGAPARLGAAGGERDRARRPSARSASSPARPTRRIFQLTAGIPTVAAFGPGFLPRAHAPNESAPVDGIVQAAEMYALAARRYLEAA